MQQSVRVYICRECAYRTPYRWVLVRHLVNVHGYPDRKARIAAMKSKYLLNRIVVRNVPGRSGLESNKREDIAVKTVKTLKEILESLADKDIDPADVVADPKTFRIVTSGDDDEETETDED